MFFLNNRVSSQRCFTFIVLLSTLPIARADYSTALNRLYRAFSRFTIQVPSSAVSNDTLLSTHWGYWGANWTKYNDAYEKYYNGEVKEPELEKEVQEAMDGINNSLYQIIGDYMGVGVQRSCRSGIEAVLQNASEWDKAGQQAASLIMALLPSLLTFGLLHCSINLEWEH